MRTDKNTLFTIGQFAAIHEITKKTLMWYDEVGLLKPDVKGENGYRYYTYRQSPTLETILMLRELNISIDEIKKFMTDRSAYNMKELLESKIDELEKNIKHLKNIKHNLVSHQKNMETLIDIDLSEIKIIDEKRHCLAVIPTTSETPSETEIEMIIAETKKYKLRRLHDASYGSMISVENLYDGNFDNYSALFIELPGIKQKNGLHIRPEGKYIRAFYKGSWNNLSGKYREILKYAEDHNIKLKGYAYETGINENVIDTMDDYITQIEIQIDDY